MLRNQDVVLDIVYQYHVRGTLTVQIAEPIPDILTGWICVWALE